MVADYRNSYLICGAGYLYRSSDQDGGIPGLATDLEDQFGDVARVELRCWDDDWDDLAEWILRRCRSRVERVRLMCVSYSWGAGFGFRKFALACRDRGIQVDAAVVSDGVAHLNGRVAHRLGISQIAACWPKPRLKLWLPDNINKENFWWFTQKNSWLRGHDIYWQDTRQRAGNHFEDTMRNHRWMDKSDTFREKVFEVAGQMFPEALS